MFIARSYMIFSLLAVFSLWPQSPNAFPASKTVAGRPVVREFKSDIPSIRSALIDAIIEDRNQPKHWFVTTFGVASLDQRKQEWHYTPYSQIGLQKPGSVVIAQSKDGALWLAKQTWLTSRNEIFRFDGENWQRVNSSELQLPLGLLRLESPLKTIAASRDGILWFICLDGMVAFDGVSFSSPVTFPILCGNHLTVSAGAVDQDGYVWLAGLGCIVRYCPSDGQFREFNTPNILNEGIALVYEDRRSRIWFADRYGHLAVYDKHTDNWTQYSVLKYLSSPRNIRTSVQKQVYINAVHDDGAGSIYVGTSRGLLVFQEQAGRWSLYTPNNSALPSRNITAIAEDSTGNLWIGTSKGIIILGK